MIATRFAAEASWPRRDRKGIESMESLTSGTMAGVGSFRCQRCGYVMTLSARDRLDECPGCAGRDFVRASLFNATTGASGPPPARDTREQGEQEERIVRATEEIDAPGEYLLFEDDGELRTVALTREWTRIGRSLAADVRFDDPTVSRRHALIVRQADGVRVLDDRSLNGVFVNGERVEWRALDDGDEIVVGRYRMTFVCVAAKANLVQPLETVTRSSRPTTT
jgi:pSer/pThr/pTyr-binding forkhead associated (FHA) protein